MLLKRLSFLTTWLLAGGLGATHLQAQTGLQTAGGTARRATGSVSYSVGQVAYLTGRGPGGTSTPGTQQPLELFVLSTKSAARIHLACSTYPNPTTALLTLEVDEKMVRQLTWHLQDLSGRELQHERVKGVRTAIALTHLAAGTYILVVRGQQHEVKTFKIIKN